MSKTSNSNSNPMDRERDEVHDSGLSRYAKERLLNQADRLEQEAISITPIVSEMVNILVQHGVKQKDVKTFLSYFMGNIFKPNQWRDFLCKMQTWPAEMGREDAIKALFELGAKNKTFLKGLDENLRRQYLPGKQIKRSPNFLNEARNKVGKTDCGCERDGSPEVSV